MDWLYSEVKGKINNSIERESAEDKVQFIEPTYTFLGGKTEHDAWKKRPKLENAKLRCKETFG